METRSKKKTRMTVQVPNNEDSSQVLADPVGPGQCLGRLLEESSSQDDDRLLKESANHPPISPSYSPSYTQTSTLRNTTSPLRTAKHK